MTNPQVQPPLVTVALSVFNGGAVLEASVRSVVNQSFTDWELLILDDGSTDGAIDRLPFLADPRIIVVRDGHNRGLSGRLNQAVTLARGRYFARVDHDDLCHPQRFARQVAFLEAHPEVDLLAAECITMDESERLNGTLPAAIDHDSICRRPWQGFPMPHPTWMGRIEWFRRHPYQDPGPYCCEDNELLLRAHRQSRYHTLPERLLAYRVRSHTPWLKLWKTRVALLRAQLGYFSRQGQWGSALLCCVTAAARVARDSWRELGHCLRPGAEVHWGAAAPEGERREWERLIQALKQGGGKAAPGGEGDEPA